MEFGEVYITSRNNLDVGKEVVRHGWAKLKEERKTSDEPSNRYADLRALEEQAQKEGKGFWASTSAPVSVGKLAIKY